MTKSNKSNLTELQQKFIGVITQEPKSKKDVLDFLMVNNIMNGMQAGACITTLRKKGYIKFDGKTIKLTHKMDIEYLQTSKRRGRPKKTA